jgi:hypothetical protein
MKVAAIVSALTLLAGILGAQVASIDGTVTNSVTGEPIKKAMVELDGVELSIVRSEGSAVTAMTDAGGHFHFENVAPGSHVIRADQVDGFWDPRNRLPGFFSPIKVAEDQHVEGVAIQLMPLGVVSGHVLDEDGDPIARAQIAVLRSVYGPRGKRWNQVASSQSNDLGEFEVINLQPGRYYLKVAAPLPKNIPPHTLWTHPEQAYPVTFYPNARDATEATATMVAPGAHVTNLDFRLRKMPAYHIRGTVLRNSAGPDSVDELRVETPESHFGANVVQLGLQPDKSFDIRGVVSGSYFVTYRQGIPGKSDISYPAQAVLVADADVNRVVLARGAELELSGTITLEGAQPRNLDLWIALLDPQATEEHGTGIARADGKFTIAAIPRAVYQMELRNLPSGKYVKSIRFGDRELNNGDIDLTEGASAPLNIVLGADGGEVDGNVQTAAAVEVTLAPSEEYAGRSDLFKRVFADASGHFQIKDVAPGEYKIFAWESDPDGNAQSVEFRKPFEGKGVAITVGPQEKATAQLTVITAGDVENALSKLP